MHRKYTPIDALTEQGLKTKAQAARYLGVSEGSIERLMRDGLTYVKVRGLVRFRIEEDLKAYIAKNVRGGKPTAGAA